MFRTHFPDITWLRAQIAQRFAGGTGWPSVVLNVRGVVDHRPDIRGPLSLFLNVRGTSFLTANGHRAQVGTDTFFITNAEQYYTLDVPDAATETFNIHLGHALAETAFRDLTTAPDRLLDVDPAAVPGTPVHFFNQLYPRDAAFDAAVARLAAGRDLLNRDPLGRDELLLGLLPPLLAHRAEVLAQVARLPAARASTRYEVYRRLRRAVDFLHAHFADEVSLDELAVVACLSKYHFVRLFRAALGCTPFEYRRQLRLRHARHLLADTTLPVGEVALWVGFTSDAAFCRAFYRATGAWPQAWRHAVA